MLLFFRINDFIGMFEFQNATSICTGLVAKKFPLCYCNPGVLLFFWIFRLRTMDNFGKFSSENTVIFADLSPKMTKMRPKYVSWGSNQEGVLLTRVR